MNTAFVLDLSSRGIRVLSGGEQPWQALGEVSLDDPRLDDRLRDLVRSGDARAAGAPLATILVPPEEIRYATLDVKDGAGLQDMSEQGASIRAALASAASEPIEDLVWDTTAAPDGGLRIAAVPRRVLQQAESFAVAHGFHPARFSARADAEAFPGWPDFGRPDGATANEVDATTAPIAGAPRGPSPQPVGPGPSHVGPPAGATADMPAGAGVDDRPRGTAHRPGPDRVTPPRLGPAAHGVHGRPATRGHAAAPAPRATPTGQRRPIRPDSDEVWGQTRIASASESAPPASGRGAGAVGVVVALLVAAGVWATLMGPFGPGPEAEADRVALETTSAPGETVAPAPTTTEARGAAGAVPTPGTLPTAIEAGASDRRPSGGPGAITLPVTLAMATQSPAAATLPSASDEAEAAGAIPITNGRPRVAPPARPAPPAMAGETALPDTETRPASAPPVSPNPAKAAAATDTPPAAEPGVTLEEAGPPTVPVAANVTAPRPRPAREMPAAATFDAIDSAVQRAVRDTPGPAVSRPRARPGGADPDDAEIPPAEDGLGAEIAAALAAVPPGAAESGSDAVARSLRPGSRPRGLGQPDPPADPVRMASADPATPPPATERPPAPEGPGADTLRLDRMNLIGIYGSQSNRRALVRLPNGRFVKVRVGDRVDGGRVSAIGTEDLQYIKGGRAVNLSMPRG